MSCAFHNSFFFFFNDTATTEIYTLSLHDALPISSLLPTVRSPNFCKFIGCWIPTGAWTWARVSPRKPRADRKSTRLNSSHTVISYAVFCLKKKNNIEVRRGCYHTERFAQLSERRD